MMRVVSTSKFVTACEDHDDGAPITSGGALLTALGNRSLLFASVHELNE
jgi:hypothetical protein